METPGRLGIQSRHRQRRRIRLVGAALLLAVIVSFQFGLDEEMQELFGVGRPLPAVVFLLSVVIALGTQYGSWRCPRCRRYLGSALNPAFCSGCGVALRE